jgi:hypothetical protein
MHEGDETCVQSFGWITEGNIPLGRPRRKKYNNIKVDFREIEWEGVD